MIPLRAATDHPPAGHRDYRFTMGRRVTRDRNPAMHQRTPASCRPSSLPSASAPRRCYVRRGGEGGRGPRNSVEALADLPQGALCGVGLDCFSEPLGVGVEVAAGWWRARRGRGCLAARRRRCRTRSPARRTCGAARAPALRRARRRAGPGAFRCALPGTGCDRASACCRRSARTAGRPDPRAFRGPVARSAIRGTRSSSASSAGSIGIARSLAGHLQSAAAGRSGDRVEVQADRLSEADAGHGEAGEDRKVALRPALGRLRVRVGNSRPSRAGPRPGSRGRSTAARSAAAWAWAPRSSDFATAPRSRGT